jgi:hypothetical protein
MDGEAMDALDEGVANRPRFGCLELPRGACCCLKGPTSA